MSKKAKEKAPSVDTKSAGICFVNDGVNYQALKCPMKGMIHAVSSETKKIVFIDRGSVTHVYTPKESSQMFGEFI